MKTGNLTPADITSMLPSIVNGAIRLQESLKDIDIKYENKINN